MTVESVHHEEHEGHEEGVQQSGHWLRDRGASHRWP